MNTGLRQAPEEGLKEGLSRRSSDTLKEIGLAEKKQIMLSVMDEIDAFCTENKLTYFLVGGTLLGAVRHKGFIPWDDDMDIGLPRKDYERLIQSFQSKSGRVGVYDHRNRRGYFWPSAKAIAENTVLYELDDRRHPIGIFIDVFPFDGFAGTREEIVRLQRRTGFYKNLLTMKHLKINRERPLLKNILVAAGRLLYLIPDRLLIETIHKYAGNEADFADCDYVCNFTGAWGEREISSSANFLSTTRLPFEGRAYCVPVGYKEYLSTVYGDYMTPPPKEKQITHHASRAYWKENED